MFMSTLTRRIATLAAAGALAAAAAVALPTNAEAMVKFGDGAVMSAMVTCNFGVSASVSYFNPWGSGYAQTRIYNWQTGRWIYNTGWLYVPTQMAGGWGMAWYYGHGVFTFRTVFGRYINGQFVAGTDVDTVCTF